MLLPVALLCWPFTPLPAAACGQNFLFTDPSFGGTLGTVHTQCISSPPGQTEHFQFASLIGQNGVVFPTTTKKWLQMWRCAILPPRDGRGVLGHRDFFCLFVSSEHCEMIYVFLLLVVPWHELAIISTTIMGPSSKMINDVNINYSVDMKVYPDPCNQGF